MRKKKQQWVEIFLKVAKGSKGQYLLRSENNKHNETLHIRQS